MKLALIIDDNQVDRDAVGDLLKRVQIRSEMAVDGSDGIRKIKKMHYDLIILDLKMPGVDGEQTLRIIKKANASIPVLIVSGYLTKEKFSKLQNLGVKGFLTKPINIKNFYQAVNQIYPINTGNN